LHFRCALVTGIDKFLHLPVNWDVYLAPWVARLSSVSGHNLDATGRCDRDYCRITRRF
jgi:hypothetical protein